MTEQKVQNGPRAHRDVLCAETAPGGLGGAGEWVGTPKKCMHHPKQQDEF